MNNSESIIQNPKFDRTWQTQLREALTDPSDLAYHFDLDPVPLETVVARYPMRITPYYLGLIETPGDPLWRQCVPAVEELCADDLPEDSLNEAQFSPVPAVVHRYPDRALLLVSGQCAGYCRFCTRKSRVGTPALCFSMAQILDGIQYIAETGSIRDVILTGGDPLLLDDGLLVEMLARLTEVPHLDILRIGSRVPVTLPQRITPELCEYLKAFAPLYLNTHFNHPRELTAEATQACARLADAGVVLGNQTVLLRGVNDDPAIILELNRGLLKARVRPYYLHQMDQARGTGHFQTAAQVGLEMIASLRGKISGMGIPQYVIDPPDGSGKRPVLSDE